MVRAQVNSGRFRSYQRRVLAMEEEVVGVGKRGRDCPNVCCDCGFQARVVVVGIVVDEERCTFTAHSSGRILGKHWSGRHRWCHCGRTHSIIYCRQKAMRRFSRGFVLNPRPLRGAGRRRRWMMMMVMVGTGGAESSAFTNPPSICYIAAVLLLVIVEQPPRQPPRFFLSSRSIIF